MAWIARCAREGQVLAWILSRVLNFFWLSKIVRIVLRGGHKQHFDENKLD